MKALLKMEFIQLKRNLTAFTMTIGMPILFFLLFSSLTDTGDPASQEVFIRNYLMTMTAFSMSGTGFFAFPAILNEDKNNNWLLQITHSSIAIWKYYLAKMIRMLIIFIITISAIFPVGAFARGVSLTAEQWFVSAILLLIGAIFYLSFGVLLAQIKSEQLRIIVGNISYFTLAILGGSWMPVSIFPEWMKNLAKCVPTYYANNLVTDYLSTGKVSISNFGFVLIYAILVAIIALVIKRKMEIK